MTMTKDELIDEIKQMTVIDLSELVKALEEEFGVSAAAPVVQFRGGDEGSAAPGGGGGRHRGAGGGGGRGGWLRAGAGRGDVRRRGRPRRPGRGG